MKELKLHAEGAANHIKSIEVGFKKLKQKLERNTQLSEREKKVQVTEARDAFLKKKKELEYKLF